jgi:hypothetical protein
MGGGSAAEDIESSPPIPAEMTISPDVITNWLKHLAKMVFVNDKNSTNITSVVFLSFRPTGRQTAPAFAAFSTSCTLEILTTVA